MGCLRPYLLIVAWFLLLAIPGEASASTRNGVGDSNSFAIVEVVAEGEVHPALPRHAVAHLTEGLQRGDTKVVHPTGVADPPRCSTATSKCRRSLAKALGVDYLVFLHIRGQAKSYEIDIAFYDARLGERVTSSTEKCHVCGVAEAANVVEHQVAALHQKLESLALDRPVLRFGSLPVDADVYIDGILVGRTPLQLEVEPGERRVEIRKTSFVSQQQTIVVTRGVSEAIRFALEPHRDPIAERERRHRRMRAAGWSLLGVAAASAGTGGFLLWLDERPYESACSGANVNEVGTCRMRYDTLWHGAGMLALGGSSLVIGSALLIVARKRKHTAAFERTKLSFGLHFRGIAVGGRF